MKKFIVFAIALLFSPFIFGQVPSANFTATPLAGCSPLVVSFQDLSSGNPTAWSWDFGNGNTSSLQTPSTTYFTPGTYTVRLTVTNARGSNTLTRTQYITVYETPTVDFSVNNQTGCFPLRVQFTDLSTGGAGNTNTAWQWDFGNGVTSTQQNPQVVYTAAGSFNIILRVTNDKGCTRIISRPAYINTTPGVVAGFTVTQPNVCTAPATVTVNNTSTGPAGTLSYLWNFGDGNTSPLENPGTHTYNTNGNYTITLVTTSSSGCEDTARRTVAVGGFTSSFTNNASVCTGVAATFTNTSTPAPASATWDFGDGVTSTSPIHTYTAPGTYTVKLYNNFGGCIDSATGSITVNPLPVADFSAPVTIKCDPSLTVNFQDLSTGGATGWQWDFGDGNTSSLQTPSNTYTNFGNYTVRLIITNANGCTDTIIKPNFVRIQRPVIVVPSLPANGCVPFTINPVANITAVDAVTSYLWDFGNGVTSTQQNPSYTYTVQGNYIVKLFITTSTGCTDSLVIPNAIRVGTNPFVDFTATPIPVCAYQPVQFNSLATPADQWAWNFGDGTTSGAENPSHIYTGVGNFTVSLTAVNNGCPGVVTKTNLIQVLPPIARFNAAITNCADRLQFTFTDASIGADGWTWDFGDGSPVSTAQSPVHSFPALGNYTVTLTVTNSTNTCSHSVTHIVRAIDQAPDFTVSAATICRRDAITFTPLNADPAITAQVLWDFGNGAQINTTTVTPVSYTYPASGTYTVRMISVDVNGCRDTIIKTNHIRVNGPRINFTATNTAGCAGLTTIFNDLSTTDGINAINSWRFDFGDGNTQTFTAPPFQHTYTTAGSFSVKLTITDAAGCTDTLTRINLVNTSDPVPDFITATTMTCPSAIINFTNTSTSGFPIISSIWDFGDGTIVPVAGIAPVSHAYTLPGDYTVKLIVTDQQGCPDSVIKTQYIHIEEPAASFTVNDTISSCTPFEARFTNTSTYFTSVVWNFGVGEGSSTLNDPVHYYSTPGTYRVKLLITSLGGCQDSAFVNIVINDTAGSRVTYTPLSGCNPITVNLNTFTNSIIDSYLWDFGDGNTITTTTPTISHTYNTFGNFVPKVIMLDPSGCLIPIIGTDTIRIIGANPGFSYSSAFFCDSGYVQFTDTSKASDPIIRYDWNFGDGTTSTLQNPLHHYTSPGIFDVTLTVRTLSNCSNTITIPAAVKVVLRPLIDITGPPAVCVNGYMLHNGIFLRQDTSQVNWLWSFPNGNTFNGQNPPQQTYTTAGSFTISAIATNSSGCKDTATQAVTIHPLPTVDMPGVMTIQTGFPATIPATFSAGTNFWAWTPANGLSCTDCPNPIASPRFNTKYNVFFSDNNGCSDTASIQVIVVCKEGNLFIPNTFSPNGDGSNERFYPRGKGLYSIKSLRIFNRWGEVVFENRNFAPNDALQGWDGTYKGKKPQADVYVYQVEVFCDNGELIKLDGNIALIL